MADNVIIPAQGGGGDTNPTIRLKDRSNVKTQIIGLDLNPAGATEALMSGTLSVVGNQASGQTDSGAPIKVAGKYNLSVPTFNTGQRGDLQIDSQGSLRVTVTSSDGTTGMSTINLGVTGSTFAVKNSSRANLYHITAFNQNSVDIWLQIFDAATGGAVTLGTTPPKVSYLVPKGDGTNSGAFGEDFTIPMSFSNGIQVAATTTYSGPTGPPTYQLVCNFGFK